MIRMSEYIRYWKVQFAYNLTDETRDSLVSSLEAIDGAIKECTGWWVVTTAQPVPKRWSLLSIISRATDLYDSLMHPTVEFPPPPKLLLSDVIRVTYQGERPDMGGLSGIFPEDIDFLAQKNKFLRSLKHFMPLYFDSLLLRRADVRAYCREHEIRQVREVKGLMREDNHWPPFAEPETTTPPAESADAHNNTASLSQPMKRYQPRKAVSAPVAAGMVGVSERQIRNWDKGINMPKGYPGRDDAVSLGLFANSYRARKGIEAEMRAMNRPISGGGIAEKYSRYASDDE
jgi:hypothetical protein